MKNHSWDVSICKDEKEDLLHNLSLFIIPTLNYEIKNA